MTRYAPVGKTLAEQISDLVKEATATGTHTVADINGVSLSAWPYDDVNEVLQEYEYLQSALWEPDGPLGHDPQYAVPLNDPETERLIDAAVGIHNRSAR